MKNSLLDCKSSIEHLLSELEDPDIELDSDSEPELYFARQMRDWGRSIIQRIEHLQYVLPTPVEEDF